MKFLQYFIYLSYNWSFKIAFHILKNERRGENKYGINTTGADDLKSLEKQGVDITHATIYMPASYDVIEEFFAKANIEQFNHFLDIGCGKGRALCVAAAMGVAKVSGIELSKALYNNAEENVAITKAKHPNSIYQLHHADAFDFDIDDDVDCIFMFNPFDEVIMCAVLENIEYSLQNNPRSITIIYINPLQKHLLLEWDYKEMFHSQKLKYLEGSIFKK